MCVTHAQLSPWSSLTQRPPVVEPKASRSPRSSSASACATNDVISVRLRQALGEDIEAFAAVARTRHDQLALARDALLILDFRDEPRRIRLARMHDDREAERRWLHARDLREGFAPAGENEVIAGGVDSPFVFSVFNLKGRFDRRL